MSAAAPCRTGHTTGLDRLHRALVTYAALFTAGFIGDVRRDLTA